MSDEARCAGCGLLLAPGASTRTRDGQHWCKACWDAWLVDHLDATCDRCGAPVSRHDALLGHDGHVLCDPCAGDWHGSSARILHRCKGCSARLTLAEDHRVKDGAAWCEACFAARFVTCDCCHRSVAVDQAVLSEQLFATMCKTCHAGWMARARHDEARFQARW